MKKLQNEHSRVYGFTVVELLVVIVVIAILAAVVIVGYGAWERKLATDGITSDLHAVSSAMEDARNWSDKGYPTSIPDSFSPSQSVTVTPERMGGATYCVSAQSTRYTDLSYYVSNKQKDPAEGTCALTVATIAGSTSSGFVDAQGANARFNVIESVVVSDDGTAYVADRNNVVRKITSDGTVTTYAGGTGTSGSLDGPADSAQFRGPRGVALDPAGNLYVADINNNSIRKITTDRIVSTFAVGIHGTDVIRSPETGDLYALNGDNFGGVVWKVSTTGTVTRIAGSGTAATVDGQGLLASFNDPRGLAVNSEETLFICENGGSRVVRKVLQDGTTTTYAGPSSAYVGGATTALAGGCTGIAIYDDVLYIATSNGRLQAISSNGTVTTLMTTLPTSVGGIAFDKDGNLWVGTTNRLYKVTIP